MMLPMRLSPQLITTSPSSAGWCVDQPLPGRLDHRDRLALGGPVEEVPVVGQLLLEPRPAAGGVTEPLEPGGPPVGAVHRGERVDAAPPHALLLLGRGLDHPALHGVRDVVRGDEALDVVHGEEGHAEVPRGPPRTSRGGGGGPPTRASARARMARYWVENLASRKSRCLVGATRTTSRRSVAVGGAGAAQDRLVGEPVGAGGLDVEDLGAGPVGRLGGQPAREGGGHLLRVALADVGHGAALYRRRGPSG